MGEKPDSFKECVAWARLLWQDLFHNQIAQLLHNFPHDQVTSSGNLFWSGPKRCPKILDFDVEDQLHYDFVAAGANLRAENYGIKGTKDKEEIKSILKQVNVPVFEPKSGVKIAVTDAEAQAQSDASVSDADIVNEILADLPESA